MLGLEGTAYPGGIVPNLVVLQHRTMRDALTFHQDPRYVVHAGRLVAESITDVRLHATAGAGSEAAQASSSASAA